MENPEGEEACKSEAAGVTEDEILNQGSTFYIVSENLGGVALQRLLSYCEPCRQHHVALTANFNVGSALVSQYIISSTAD